MSPSNVLDGASGAPTVNAASAAIRRVLVLWCLLALADVVLSARGFAGLHRLMAAWRLRGRCTTGAEQSIIADGRAALDRARLWYFKRAKCLQRASALVCYLRLRGVDAQLVIGVRKIPFAAHAWAELAGLPLDERPAVTARYNVITRC